MLLVFYLKGGAHLFVKVLGPGGHTPGFGGAKGFD